jgi:hypothetical protein
MTAAAIKASRKFTWQELAELNEWHNVHVAVSGKVRNQDQHKIRHKRIPIVAI